MTAYHIIGLGIILLASCLGQPVILEKEVSKRERDGEKSISSIRGCKGRKM